MPPDGWTPQWETPVGLGPVLTDPPERLPRHQPRQITQITGDNHGLFALCSDGTVWQLLGGMWLPEPPIPQRQLAEG